MSKTFNVTKQQIVQDLQKLIVEVESKTEFEFLHLVERYKHEEDAEHVALCHMFYIDESRLNKRLK